jgi:hypothetical protein
MKNDLTIGAWQHNVGCPIRIVLASTSDAIAACVRPQRFQFHLPLPQLCRKPVDVHPELLYILPVPIPLHVQFVPVASCLYRSSFSSLDLQTLLDQTATGSPFDARSLFLASLDFILAGMRHYNSDNSCNTGGLGVRWR